MTGPSGTYLGRRSARTRSVGSEIKVRRFGLLMSNRVGVEMDWPLGPLPLRHQGVLYRKGETEMELGRQRVHR